MSIHLNECIAGGAVKAAHYPRLKDLREDNDLTQKDVAKLYNTSVDYILGVTDNPNLKE